jgi:hypothetical protein
LAAKNNSRVFHAVILSRGIYAGKRCVRLWGSGSALVCLILRAPEEISAQRMETTA